LTAEGNGAESACASTSCGEAGQHFLERDEQVIVGQKMRKGVVAEMTTSKPLP
jgi:hypothetical protein